MQLPMLPRTSIDTGTVAEKAINLLDNILQVALQSLVLCGVILAHLTHRLQPI